MEDVPDQDSAQNQGKPSCRLIFHDLLLWVKDSINSDSIFKFIPRDQLVAEFGLFDVNVDFLVKSRLDMS